MSKVGHPTDYKTQYCEQLISFRGQGYSLTSFAAHIGVSRQTLYNWAKEHPEFKEARDIAHSACRLFWEQQGIEGLWEVTEYDPETGKPAKTKRINSTVYCANMNNMFWTQAKKDARAGQPEAPAGDISVIAQFIKGIASE